MLKLFSKYFTVGIFNTAISWVVFALCLYAMHTSQAVANFVSFCIAVTFSFFVNAKFTFNSAATKSRYFTFVGFMGFLAYVTGMAADALHLPGIVTMIFFSGLSLVFGFLYSNFIVFK
ncbi:GtrA family protein [Citrobacter farmeri]|nr:GtrA family protein [Citrobacter farmeri]HED1903259.1 GtrA family protein [Citrobacter farmeri]